jgi:cell division septation protein DedD
MAGRRGSGLSFGQLITLTFGFLLASVVIFVFGIWVGRDLAEQRALREREVAHVPVAPPEPARPTVARIVAPGPATLAAFPPSTATRIPPAATATAVPTARATATRAAAGGGWTVQAYATNDTVRAIMLSRTLRAKGYDASTGTKQVGNMTWYTVKVGRFRDHAAAKAMESKLREVEGLEAATVISQ